MRLATRCSPLLFALACALPLPVFADASPAQRAMAAAEASLARQPGAEGLAALALAHARRARETADTDHYLGAMALLDQAESLAPGNALVARNRVWVLLGQHEFARAQEAASALHRRHPDDLMVLAMLTDARIELGRYAEAENSAQWLLDMRPGNIPGLTRAAYLREIFGDPEGALDLMAEALRRTREGETEDRAWLMTQMSHLSLSLGRLPAAARLADEALAAFPGYHYALAQKARVLAARGDASGAATLLATHVAAAPHPENYYYLGEALARAGRTEAARAAYAEFEARAVAESLGWDNANRELVYYYADVAGKPAEALAVAEREIARRRDVATLQAWAWALHRNGRQNEAWAAMEEALAVGSREPELLRRAGLIARAAGKVEPAGRLLGEARRLAPWLGEDDTPGV